jgi:NIMA (never in mitosis gene a)-related kinase
LKPANIFLTSKGILKIGDLGIAKVLASTKAKASTRIGTPLYASPEIILGKPYTSSTDVWSLGVILYELCALKWPFYDENDHILNNKIISGKFTPLPENFSEEIKTLVKNCLDLRPDMRPSVN